MWKSNAAALVYDPTSLSLSWFWILHDPLFSQFSINHDLNVERGAPGASVEFGLDHDLEILLRFGSDEACDLVALVRILSLVAVLLEVLPVELYRDLDILERFGDRHVNGRFRRYAVMGAPKGLVVLCRSRAAV